MAEAADPPATKRSRSRSPVRASTAGAADASGPSGSSGPSGLGACRFDAENPGSCRFGATCRFTHSGAANASSDRRKPAAGSFSVCFDFQNRGKCSRGEQCPFDHADPKTSMCNDFVNGFCRRGDSCRFSHNSRQVADAANPPRRSSYESDVRQYSSQTSYGDDQYGNYPPRVERRRGIDPQATNVCFDFQNRGACSRGESCRFEHQEPSKSSCQDFKHGHCRRGDSCRFAHDNAPASTATKPAAAQGFGADRSTPEPCYDFQKGACRYGATCKYFHDIRHATGFNQPPYQPPAESYGPPANEGYGAYGSSQRYGEPAPSYNGGYGGAPAPGPAYAQASYPTYSSYSQPPPRY